MAADFIPVDRSKQPGNNFVRAADLTVELRGLIAKIVANGNHMNDGSSYALLESEFGLAPGAGANALTLLNIMNDILNGTAGAGGATQQGQIAEFCARVAGQ